MRYHPRTRESFGAFLTVQYRKTQIAIEQCYRFRDVHPEAHIFWAHAGTISKFGQACKAIAEDLQLPHWNNPQTDVIQLVHRWLTSERTGPWLLVADNIDDLDVLESPLPSKNTMTLSQFLLKSAQGFVLITTRDKRVGERLGVRGKTIRVGAMTMPEGRQVLRSYLPSEMELEEGDLEELVSSLDYIPLAITQAAALITENCINIKEYLAMFRSSDEEMQQLLSESLSDNRRSNHESNSVIRSWRLSFDQITKQCPRAAEILSLMAMFDREGIPRILLERQNESKLTFLKAMGILQAFSLIAKEADKEGYGMHRLVQLSTQTWLKVQQRQGEWIKQALCVLEMRFPGTGRYESWRTCEALLPHARALLQHELVTRDDQISRAILRKNVARYDYDQGRHSLALVGVEEAGRIARALLGSRDPLTLTITNQVIMYQIGTGKDREAMELAQHHIPIYEEVLGVDHLETLTCNRNIAFLLSMRGESTKAEVIYRKTLARLETALGGDHESTLTVMSALAGVIWDQGKNEEAENMYREVIAKQERVFGADHPATLTSIWGQVQCLRLEERFEEAELLCRFLYITGRRVLGPEHIRTLLNMSELASSLSAQSKFQEAEDLFRATVERMKKLFETDQHQEITLRAMAKFGECLANQGKHEEAAELYQVAYRLHQNLSGRTYEKTVWIMESFASCLDAPGKPIEAKPHRLLCTQLVSGVKHPPLLPPSSHTDILMNDKYLSNDGGLRHNPHRSVAGLPQEDQRFVK